MLRIPRKQNGVLLILSGLSATGKSYLTDKLVKEMDFTYVPSVTTRPPRPGEQNGIDKIFCSQEEFNIWQLEQRLICEKEMFGNWYALDITLLRQYKEGRNIICQLRYTSVLDVKAMLPGCSCIYIWPESINAAVEYLTQRDMDENERNMRLSEIAEEIDFIKKDKTSENPIFDYHFTNQYNFRSEQEFLALVRKIIDKSALNSKYNQC